MDRKKRRELKFHLQREQGKEYTALKELQRKYAKGEIREEDYLSFVWLHEQNYDKIQVQLELIKGEERKEVVRYVAISILFLFALYTAIFT